MLTWVIRRRVEAVFAAISAGDWAAATAGLTADAHHVFPGDHPLGGERHTRAAILEWFARLGRLFPGHEFTMETVALSGPPWAWRVAVQWSAELRPAVGESYRNEGSHWLRLRWFRVAAFHAYLDTQRIAAACDAMAAAGIAEASAAPITDRIG